jgi:hypothetical protein
MRLRQQVYTLVSVSDYDGEAAEVPFLHGVAVETLSDEMSDRFAI